MAIIVFILSFMNYVRNREVVISDQFTQKDAIKMLTQRIEHGTYTETEETGHKQINNEETGQQGLAEF